MCSQEVVRPIPRPQTRIRVGKSENNSEARRLTAICDQQIKLWFYWEASRCECVSGAEGWREGVPAKTNIWTESGSAPPLNLPRQPMPHWQKRVGPLKWITLVQTPRTRSAHRSLRALNPEDWRKTNTCGIWTRADCLSIDSKSAFLFSFCQTHPSDSSIKIQCLSTELFWNWTPASRQKVSDAKALGKSAK